MKDWKKEGRVEPGIVSFNPHQTTREQGRKEGRSFKLSGKFLVLLLFSLFVSMRVGEKTCLKFFGISINRGRGRGTIEFYPMIHGTRIFLEP